MSGLVQDTVNTHGAPRTRRGLVDSQGGTP